MLLLLLLLLLLYGLLPLLLHPFNGLFSSTTWGSRYQKGKTSLDLNEARDYGVWGWQWHQPQKGKVFPYSLPSVGPGADPGVQAVSPQVT